MKTMLKLSAVFMLMVLFVIPSYAQQNKQGMGKNQNNFKEQLNLTDEQESQIEDLKIAHRREMIDLRADLEKTELKMMELLKDGNVDRTSFMNVQNEVIAKENVIKTARANHLFDVYELLNDDQKDDWLKMALRKGGKHKSGERFGKHKMHDGTHRRGPDKY